ncbi:MAG: hypothetical protein IJR34_06005 [Bacteroidales bacterium]|nr:hypothetical protein [Bacteroidales bacterium]MCR4564682.1 hypothetical protein [Bacteroidales bacterium]
MKRKTILLYALILCLMTAATGSALFILYKDAPEPQVKSRDGQIENLLSENEEEKKDTVVQKKEVVADPNTDGPFSVLNSSTGKVNSLQRKDGKLSLTDEKGKVLWSIPFETPLCSMAGTIDYYANGRLQFLFISDDEIRLFDRKGNEVSEVRKKLEKPVRIGPAIYDFSGKKKYNILTLNKDNTIDMYNLQGKKPAKWEGITTSEPIHNLPRYIIRKGKSYWWLSTEKNCYLYAFMGGTPLKTFPVNTAPGDVSF